MWVAWLKKHFSTIRGSGDVDCHLVKFKIKGIGGQHVMRVNNALTCDSLPKLSDSIPTQADVNRYSHLQGIRFPHLSADRIAMIIGVAEVDAFCVLEFRKGPEGSPLALKSVLGWSIGGPDRLYTNSGGADDAEVNFCGMTCLTSSCDQRDIELDMTVRVYNDTECNKNGKL